ncbi:MAG: dihydrodipicolinate synthase family protein [Candidatus Aminicenantes bacterium]|nr:dihydrodipicolinate synthase family protein [Candidatus Aminicenantes bacterium]
MSKNFQGIFPALTTPFEGEDLAVHRFRENIAKFNALDLSGYVVLGSTGECVLLSNDESERLVRAARETTAPGKLVIAGTGQESTKLTTSFTNRMAAVGADAALVRPPSYYKAKMTKDVLRSHYLAVADGARIPVIVYNIPQNTGVTIEPELLIELSAHPNIVGLKESSGIISYLGKVIPHVPENFSCLVGSGFVILPALVMGASGAILAVANAAPAACLDIFRLFKEGRIDEATQRQLALTPLNKAVMETYGLPGLKYAMEIQGYYGGPVRRPLLSLAEAAKPEIEELVKALNSN